MGSFVCSGTFEPLELRGRARGKLGVMVRASVSSQHVAYPLKAPEGTIQRGLEGNSGVDHR